jgi:hypothetical protein
VQLVDRAGAWAGAWAGEVGAPLIQHAQHRRRALGRHRAGIPVQGGDAGGRGGIQGVGLASTTRQFAHPSGRGGRDVQDGLASREQSLGEMAAQPAAFFTAHCRSPKRFAQVNSLR